MEAVKSLHTLWKSSWLFSAVLSWHQGLDYREEIEFGGMGGGKDGWWLRKGQLLLWQLDFPSSPCFSHTEHTASQAKNEQMFDIVLRCDEMSNLWWFVCMHLESIAAIGNRSRSMERVKLFLGVYFILDSPPTPSWFNPLCYGALWELSLTVLGRRKLSLRRSRNFWVTRLGSVSLVIHPQALYPPRVRTPHVRVLILQWKCFMLWKLSLESFIDVAEFQRRPCFIRCLGISPIFIHLHSSEICDRNTASVQLTQANIFLLFDSFLFFVFCFVYFVFCFSSQGFFV